MSTFQLGYVPRWGSEGVKTGVGQNIASHAWPAARDSDLPTEFMPFPDYFIFYSVGSLHK